MSAVTQHDSEFDDILCEFMNSLELVFKNDWEFTKGILNGENSEYFIEADADFLDPGVHDESNNWANRGAFLSSYRDLVDAMTSRGLGPEEHSIDRWKARR